MASRTDARERMVGAGEELFSRRGYGVTMLDVVERAEAPRGSIYYHFPQGKQELAMEVAAKVERELHLLISRTAERVPDATTFLQRLVEHHRKRLVASGYELGCPLMGIIATGEAEDAGLGEAIERGFISWTGAISRALEDKGLPAEAAARLGSLVVSGIEGCIMVSRAQRSPNTFVAFGRSLPLLVAGALGGTPA